MCFFPFPLTGIVFADDAVLFRGSTCAACFLFAFFCIAETKGLSLEQIDLLYRESSIIGSNKYRQQMLAENETFANHDGAIGDTKTHDGDEKLSV